MNTIGKTLKRNEMKSINGGGLGTPSTPIGPGYLCVQNSKCASGRIKLLPGGTGSLPKFGGCC